MLESSPQNTVAHPEIDEKWGYYSTNVPSLYDKITA
jgi:hypothetical protein